MRPTPPRATRSGSIAPVSSSPARTRKPNAVPTRAVFFDVDFTLIYPGPTFGGEGYRAFCARYGIDVDAGRFDAAVAAAAPLLDQPDDAIYDPEVFIAYTDRIIEG